MPLLRVVTANLLHGLVLASGRVDLDAAASLLEPLAADVVAVQEVDRRLGRSGGTDQVALLAERLGMRSAFAPALSGDPDRAWRVPGEHDDGGPAYGIGLLARHPLRALRRVRLPGGGAGRRSPQRRERRPPGVPNRPPRPGWDLEPRVALSAVVRLAAAAQAAPAEIRVTTAHLSYLPWRGLAGLRLAARVARAGGGPAVLCGDLNLPAWLVGAVAVGWRAAGGAPTYPAWRPVMQPDQVLVRGDVAVERATVRAGPGDHRMLVVDLRIGR